MLFNLFGLGRSLAELRAGQVQILAGQRAHQAILQLMLQENRTMSATTQDKLAQISAKEDAEAAAIADLTARVSTRDTLLQSIQTKLDAATSTIADDQTQLQALKDQLAAMPTDTAAAEALIDSIMAKQDANVAALSAIETFPADPAPAAPPIADPAPAPDPAPAAPTA